MKRRGRVRKQWRGRKRTEEDSMRRSATLGNRYWERKGDQVLYVQ